jgi:hypothetical protein
MTSISEILSMPGGAVLERVQGILKSLGHAAYDNPGAATTFHAGSTQTTAGPKSWSVQWLVLADVGTEIAVQVANQNEIKPDKIGRSLYLLSHEIKGRRVGVKTDVENGKPILRVSASGELLWEEPGSMLTAPNVTGGAPVTTAVVSRHSLPAAVPASPALSAGTGAVAVGSEQARVDELVRLYDLCLVRTIAGAGNTIADNSGIVICQDAVMAATGEIFRAMLSQSK